MKKIKIWAIFLCILVACSIWIYGETNQDENVSKQIEELQKQLTKLEKKIEILEKEIQWLAERSVETPETFPKLQKIPEGWKEYEFNGVKYYIIPVKPADITAEQKKK
jgi:peptidoglycan hydrolase CwlO-like protein